MLHIIVLGMVIGVYIAFSFLHSYLNRVFVHDSISTIKSSLSPGKASKLDLLRSRALANQRLFRALGITNTFVSPDADTHKQFVTESRQLLNAAEKRGWPHFSQLAFEAVRITLLSNQTHTTLPFHVFVQTITLRVVIIGILGVDVDIADLLDEDVSEVARLVTKLWALSKLPKPIDPGLLQDLKSHLQRLVPEQEHSKFSRLDFIIPAWETLWRLVAINLVHIYEKPQYRSLFKEFTLKPSDHQYAKPDCLGTSVKLIIDESIRLYPPTRHISRVSTRPIAQLLPLPIRQLFVTLVSPRLIYQVEYADVEAVQRSKVWGADAHEFNPMRFHPTHLTLEQKDTMSFSFGLSPLGCIAKSWAPMAAAIITGSIIETLEEEKCEILPGSRVGGRGGWDAWKIIR